MVKVFRVQYDLNYFNRGKISKIYYCRSVFDGIILYKRIMCIRDQSTWWIFQDKPNIEATSV